MKRMLVIRFSALGDVAMTIPAIYSLARRYPNLRIDVVTRPFFAKLFINRPDNIDIIEADFKTTYRGARGMMRLMCRLSKLRPNCVADLHNVLRSWTIDTWMKLHGVKVAMVDKNRRSRRKLFTDKIAQRNFVDRYTDVFERLGYPVELTFRSLYQEVPAAPPVDVPEGSIGIAPFARYYNKTYPPEMMHRVVELLCKRGYHVWLFGGRGREEEELASWADDIKGCRSVAGKYSIDLELAMMSRMKVMVSMDSANQHLASLAGTPVLSIWGSTTPACGFLGYGQSQLNAIVKGLPCQPCTVAGSPTCPLGHLDCLCSIEPQLIVQRIINAIDR
ncbi:MAG: glycosyltransferase family 9 protein [Bacteroides sp.]|nr:glycosyltransferase family 9 protein [Bacteroides sp.]MCM1413503.1 glycosyltransferase family 9 protein [Bacteroides sp.]MCM1471057.1 glycosyltransferase family 9 protein [Bacteroides sp.]